MKDVNYSNNSLESHYGNQSLEINDLIFSYQNLKILTNFNLSIHEGEILVLLGKSGCGKTTLLKLIAGILQPQSGNVHLNKNDITKFPPEMRNIGYVPQTQILFNNMTVEDNIKYGLKIKRKSVKEVNNRTKEISILTQIEHKLKNFPYELSVGEQQRVALARALILNPSILLLDEPLASIDTSSRERLALIIRNINYETKIPILYVTHNSNEAQLIGDRIAIMNDGCIIQTGLFHEIKTNLEFFDSAEILGLANIWKISDINQLDSEISTNFLKFISQHSTKDSNWFHIPPNVIEITDTIDQNEINSHIQENSIQLSNQNLIITGNLLITQEFEGRFLLLIAFSSVNYTEFIKVEWNKKKGKIPSRNSRIILQIDLDFIQFY